MVPATLPMYLTNHMRQVYGIVFRFFAVSGYNSSMRAYNVPVHCMQVLLPLFDEHRGIGSYYVLIYSSDVFLCMIPYRQPEGRTRMCGN